MSSRFGIEPPAPFRLDLVDRFRGVKPPRFATLFEGLVNAVACQQLSLEMGIRLLNRFASTYGLAAGEPPEAAEILQRERGLGRWPAEYVLLRTHGRLDMFPGDDVGARNKLQRWLQIDTPPSYDEIRSTLARWYPFAGLVYFHLLLDGLGESGRM